MKFLVEMDKVYLQKVNYIIEAEDESKAIKIAEDAEYYSRKPDWIGPMELSEDNVVGIEMNNPLTLVCLQCDYEFEVDGDIPGISSRDSEDAMCPNCYGLATTTKESLDPTTSEQMKGEVNANK